MVPSFSPHPRSNGTFDDLLRICWPHQECSSCLNKSPCSWCPTVSHLFPSFHAVTDHARVLNLHTKHFQNTNFCTYSQSRCLPALVRAVGAQDSASGLPCLDHHVFHVYHLSAVHFLGNWAHCRRSQARTKSPSKLED